MRRAIRGLTTLLALLASTAAPARADEVPGPPPPPPPPVSYEVPPPPANDTPQAVERLASPPAPAPAPTLTRQALPATELTQVVRMGAFRTLSPADWRRCCAPIEIPRGPVELRDNWMLAQPRMTLPHVSPDPIPRGRWALRVHVDWGNDFGFSQRGPAESPLSDRRFIVDGEHVSVDVGLRYGLKGNVDVGIRIPVYWRGAGILDPLIDMFHTNTPTLDNARNEFLQNQYRIQGRDSESNEFNWDDEKGLGLGNIELEGHWAFLERCRAADWRAALIGRVGLPTGTGPFKTSSWDLGVQVVAAKRLHRRVDLYGGVGGTWYSHTNTLGFEYVPFRGYAFMAVEWRILRRWSILLQSDYSTRLIRNVVDYPAVQWYAYLGAKTDLSERTRLLLGFTENVISQQSTTDFAVWVGIESLF